MHSSFCVWNFRISSVQFSHSVMSDSLQPHESQHARPPCPSPTPGVYANPCPSSWWCHPAMSSFVVHFSSCPQSIPASESFPTSQLFAWGGQSIGVSASASVLPMNIQDWFPLGWTGWISLYLGLLLSNWLTYKKPTEAVYIFNLGFWFEVSLFSLWISHFFVTNMECWSASTYK